MTLTAPSRAPAVSLALALLAVLVVTPLLGASAASAAGAAGEVFIVQGVPESEVDVELDGEEIERSVRTGTVLGPLVLPAGGHAITFTSGEWTVTTSFDVAGPSVDVVLHWPADPAKQPETTVFSNDVDPVAAGKGRLTVAHTAVVPPADVRVDGKVLFANIANGEFITAEVPEDTYPVDIVPTGGTSPLLGPVDLDVKAGSLTRVFAIGQPRAGSMDAIVQVVSLDRGGSAAPTTVHAGSAGLVAPGRDRVAAATPPPGVAGVLATAIVAAAGLVSAGRRRVDR